MATPTTEPARLPPGPRVPQIVQGVAFLAAREEVVAALARRYGGAFTVSLPIFGQTVVIGDPIPVKDLFSTGIDVSVARRIRSARFSAPDRRGALTAANSSSVADCWRRRFMASG